MPIDFDDKPLVLEDPNTGEKWTIDTDDPLYEPLRTGAIVVTPDKIEAVRKWWYDKASKTVNQNFQDIPWKELTPTVKDIHSATLTNLSEKLAKISYYLGVVIQEKALLESSLSLAKKAFEQSLEKRILADDNGGTKVAKKHRILDSNLILKVAMVDIWEKEALVAGLDGIQQRLDLLWRTVSRIITTRLKEPLE